MANHSISIDFYFYINLSAQRQHRPTNQRPTMHFRPYPMARTVPQSLTKTFTIFKMGLVGLASHSKRKLYRLAACYGSGNREPVIHLQNDMTMMMTHNGGVYEPLKDEPSMLLSGDQRRGPLWQKNILMGGKCQLPDFSGVILYDSDGQVVPPAKNSLPLLTWK